MPRKIMLIVSQEFYTNQGSFSGFVEELAKFAHKKGYTVKILCGESRKHRLKEKLAYAEVNRFSLKSFPFLGNVINGVILGIKIRKFIRKHYKHENVFIVANGESALGLMGLKYVLRAGDQPAQICLKNLEIAKNEVNLKTRIARYIHTRFLYLLEKLYVNRAVGIIFSSYETRGLFDKYYKINNKPYFIPHSGVNIDRFQKGKKQNISGVKLLFIGRYGERIRKGIMYLERVLPTLFDKYNKLKLIHVGEKFEWHVQDKYKEKIISVGRIPWGNINDYYKTADILVNCSIHEMFPNTIIEAMASGTPVVTSNVNGVNEYLDHLKSGVIYKRGDTKGLEKGIIFLVENPIKAKIMAKNAKTKIKKLDNEIYYENLVYFIEESYNKEKAKSVNLLE